MLIRFLILNSAPGGLTMREGTYIIEELYSTGRLEALDLCEVNPQVGSLGDAKRTIDSAIYLVKAACGTHRSGNLPINATDIPSPK